MADSVVRKAGLLERYHVARCSVGHDSCVIVSGHYSTETEILNKAALYPALAKLIHTHPALGVCIDDENKKNPSYVRLQTVDLDQIVRFVEDDDLARTMEREFTISFDMSGKLPLWKLLVLKSGVAMFAFLHCIGDGKSGIAFHASLIQALNDPPLSTDEPASIITVPSSIQLLPPVEKLVNLSVSISKTISELYRAFAPASWTTAHTVWTGNVVAQTASLQTMVHIFHFSPEESLRFLEVCRANRSTLTAAFHILACSIVARQITNVPEKFKTISSNIVVSLRPMSRTPDLVFCDYVSSITFLMPATQMEFSWSASAALTSDIRSTIHKSPERIGLIKFLFGNERAFFRGKLNKKRGCGLELSNLGKFPDDIVKPEDKWKINRLVFAQCDIVGGPAIHLNVVGDPEGGVGICVTWCPAGINESFVESFMEEFKNRFYELLEPLEVK